MIRCLDRRSCRVRRRAVLLVLALAGCGGSAEGDGAGNGPLSGATGSGPGARCLAPDPMIGLDHAIIAVRDLDAAVSGFEGAGFRIKAGRPHANGLLNAHLKLRDSTEVELMSVPGEPTDVIAQGYHAFLEGGEGGAFVAFRTVRGDPLAAAAAAGVPAESLGGQYVVFPELPRVFVLRTRLYVEDPDSLLAHPNGAAGLAAVWLEGDARLRSLLVALGAEPCGSVSPPTGVGGGPGEAFAVADGLVVVVPPEDPGRPVLRGVVLDRTAAAAVGPTAPPREAHGVWVSLGEGR